MGAIRTSFSSLSNSTTHPPPQYIGWVLPLGAFLTLGLAVAIPLALRPGTEAFEEEKRLLEERRGMRKEEEEE